MAFPAPEAPYSLVGTDAIEQMMDLVKLVPHGDLVEVGVYKGGTAWHLARFAASCKPTRIVQLFDTFTGIPVQTPEDLQHKVGDFGDTSLELVQTALAAYKDHIVYHEGYFPETIPKSWLLHGIEPFIAFIHVDADQYTSIRDCIKYLWPLVKTHGVMLFDDYRHTSGCKLAVDEGFDPGEVAFTSQGRPFVVKPPKRSKKELA